ncbi:MAG: hypothetical protein C0464_01390 [Cyanobacteria bacterium DS2.008]|nr:hypothetical protein [Cyanobacteria bacterium DS2.008]
MQKHPMLSVKEAAEALRIDERSVRDRLTNGTLKGEKKMVGLREKWFIYSGAVQSALAKQDDMNFVGNPQESIEPQTVDATSVSFTDTEEPFDSAYGDLDEVTHTQAPIPPSRGDWHPESKANMELLVETFMKPLVDKVAAQERALIEQATLVTQQEKVIEEQKIQLRLLPDLQRRAEQEAEAAKATELKLHEAAALQKQADLVSEQKAKELANKEAQMAELQAQVASVEEENKILEAKASEAIKLSESLQALERKVEQLQKPFWKKWFEVQK